MSRSILAKCSSAAPLIVPSGATAVWFSPTAVGADASARETNMSRRCSRRPVWPQLLVDLLEDDEANDRALCL